MKQNVTRFLAALIFVMTYLAAASLISAQTPPAFIGDYDRAFAAPNGYYVDPQEPDPTVSTFQTYFHTGEYAPDGSIIAGGRHVDNAPRGDFYIRKFTPTGAIDTSFGTGGFVRTGFHSRFDGVGGNDTPSVLKVQPDGKILFAGQCTLLEPSQQTAAFGVDACLIRYNANGTLDQTFGGATLVYTSQGTNPVHATTIEPGKVIFQTGIVSSGQSFGTGGTFHEMAIQPDGKIVLVGETRNYTNFFAAQGYGAIIVRLNPNGSLDTTFGAGGIARWTAPEGPVAGCFPSRAFYGVRLQADGRILAVGYDEATRPGDCATGSRFVVTRWTAAGQLETVRHLDNVTTFTDQREGAAAILLTRDGSKILVSGAYNNLGGTASSAPDLLTMVRFNLNDLSVDATFGNGGIVQHGGGCGSVFCGFNSGGRLLVKAIQPDGKILAVDGGGSSGNVVRFNPDGSSDQSFGNESQNGVPGLRGRLRVQAQNFNGVLAALEAGQILVRPNGRINLIGFSAAHAGLGILRAVVSQQFTVFENGVYSDFENDARANISVFRNGNWFWLDSTNNQFRSAQFGIASDKLAPADYDGDGRTDRAVFRDGNWYISQSSNNQFRAVFFGQTGDSPRPGDFDGDGLADISVFRPSSGTWYRLNSSNNQFVAVQFGASGDAPVLADFDADGRTDIAVFRQGVWYWLNSSTNQFNAVQFGSTGDVPVAGDYDADSRSDVAVFRPSNGTWYRLNSSTNQFVAVQFGQSGDRPVPGDYDNDGRNDLAVYRAGNWFVLRSSNNQFMTVSFGLTNDTPIPSAYLP